MGAQAILGYPCTGRLEAFGTMAWDLAAFLVLIARSLGWFGDDRKRGDVTIINIGANNGVDGDPVHGIMAVEGLVRGLAAEMDPKLCADHRANLPHVFLWCGMVTPANVGDFLEAG